MSSADESGLPPGTVVERYRVEETIGAGSMGDVVRALDVDLNRPVALKILSNRHRENDELRARFVREARAVAAISHDNVVQVFTTGTHDDRPYIAMELLRGEDLGSVVKSRGAMSSVQAAIAIRDAALGLQAAAEAGLIHRDVKPSNLVLLENGKVKVTDFGLAKPLDPAKEPALTALGVVVGTPDYIAPEQARGDTIDERVDIYALGGTLFYLLIGTPPYRKGNPIDDKYLKVVARHLKDPVPNARSRDRSVDRELSKLCRAMMAKKAVDRPTYDEISDQLDAIIARLERGGADTALPHTGSHKRVKSEPTPFVGGDVRIDDSDAGSAPSRRRRRSSAPRSAEYEKREAMRQRRRSSAGYREADDAAKTAVRISTSHDRLGGSSFVHRPRRSGWLIAVTVLSFALFAVGLGLMLFGPKRDSQASTDNKPQTTVTMTDAAPPAPVLLPSAPDGMVLVLRDDGTPWFFVDKAPVTRGAFSAVYPNIKRKSRKLSERAVRSVSFNYARNYAKALSRRLPTTDEWAAAAKTEGFTGGTDLWEWVADSSPAVGNKRSIRRAPDKLTRRSRGSHADVTFRTALDIDIAGPADK